MEHGNTSSTNHLRENATLHEETNPTFFSGYAAMISKLKQQIGMQILRLALAIRSFQDQTMWSMCIPSSQLPLV